jgi:hypothetical protein
MFVCCECCVLPGRGLCDGLITRLEESYRLWCVVVCDQETSENEEAKARYRAVENTTIMGCNDRKTNRQTNNIPVLYGVFHNETSLPRSQ